MQNLPLPCMQVQAKKGPKEVCSILNQYITSHISPEVKDLHDASSDQNHTVIRFLLNLTMIRRFNVANVYFPVRGHSFLPCGRIYSFVQYDEMIEGAKRLPLHLMFTH